MAERLAPSTRVIPRARGPVRALAALVVLCLLVPAVTSAEAGERCSAKPIVVKIHADWCATCKMLDAVWTQLRTDMADQINVVELDVSDRVAYQESEARAEQLGLTDFFRKYRSKTGTIAILDCNSLEPVAIMNGERDIAKYREAIARASRPT